MKKILFFAAALPALVMIPCFAEDSAEVKAEPQPPATETVKDAEEAEPEFVAEDPNAAPADALPPADMETLPEGGEMNYKRCVKIPYVVITSNDKTAMFLAEEAMKEERAVVIVVPDSEDQVKNSSELIVQLPTGNIILLTAGQLSRFLAFLRPLNVILLGSDAVMPKIFSLSIPSYCTKLTVNDTSWKVNAVKLDDILNTNHKIYQRYQTFFKEEMSQALDEAKSQERELIPGQEPAESVPPAASEEQTAEVVEFEENNNDQIPEVIPLMDKE